jgi:hypothetical protein
VDAFTELFGPARGAAPRPADGWWRPLSNRNRQCRRVARWLSEHAAAGCSALHIMFEPHGSVWRLSAEGATTQSDPDARGIFIAQEEYEAVLELWPTYDYAPCGDGLFGPLGAGDERP